MRLKKRKLHELLYTEIGRSGTIRLATGILTYINPHELHITTHSYFSQILPPVLALSLSSYLDWLALSCCSTAGCCCGCCGGGHLGGGSVQSNQPQGITLVAHSSGSSHSGLCSLAASCSSADSSCLSDDDSFRLTSSCWPSVASLSSAADINRTAEASSWLWAGEGGRALSG